MLAGGAMQQPSYGAPSPYYAAAAHVEPSAPAPGPVYQHPMWGAPAPPPPPPQPESPLVAPSYPQPEYPSYSYDTPPNIYPPQETAAPAYPFYGTPPAGFSPQTAGSSAPEYAPQAPPPPPPPPAWDYTSRGNSLGFGSGPGGGANDYTASTNSGGLGLVSGGSNGGAPYGGGQYGPGQYGGSEYGGGEYGASSGVVQYQGAGEPYGARGTGSGAYWGATEETPNRSSDNTYVTLSSGAQSGDSRRDGAAATGAADGVQRFNVQLLPEGAGSNQSVVCQVGLDGLRLMEASNGRLLRVYPLDTITCWAVKEPSVFTFWARSSVDVEQRAVRLQSSEYVTSSVLDALTAACVQLYEMGGKEGAGGGSAPGGGKDEGSAAKGGPNAFMEWVAAQTKARAPAQEEKEHWVPDQLAAKCNNCNADFSAFLRRHHCRNCGGVFCDKCTRGRSPLTAEPGAPAVRVCDHCLAEVTQRLTHAKETGAGVSPVAAKAAPGGAGAPRSHQDLAKQLEEELQRNTRRAAASASAAAAEGQRGTGGGGTGGGGNGRPEGASWLLSCKNCHTVTVAGPGQDACPSCGVRAGAPDNGTTRAGGVGPAAQPRRNLQQVVCPTCTVHLEVEVPSVGTETVECGVCAHPFLVGSA
eukprot:TRINITY_DN39366_c0_g1_i1.p1 TRINITY_DN39366_c0_g1~~TRINITY_DN39366_c0_g1_i1.p1  ORF type:complete len:639 (-),score=115.27 TRINITY_DN39366_c0_g1_i1:298-2214(-)